jgi:hypothetical protein
MPDDAGCKIFVVRGDPASLISNTGVNTVFSGWWHGQWRFLYGWTRYLPVHPRKDPGPCRCDHGAYGLFRSLHGWFTDVRGCPQINNWRSFFAVSISVVIRNWLCTVRDQSVCASMLVYWKYLYTDGPGLYTVTSVATRYLPVYSRNKHGWFSLPDGPGRRPVLPRFVTDHYGLSVTVQVSSVNV